MDYHLLIATGYKLEIASGLFLEIAGEGGVWTNTQKSASYRWEE